MSTKNARFWIWENNGWIKLTLRPGQELTWTAFSTHDEGWSRYSTVWEYCGDVVECHQYVDGCDCDGRHSQDIVHTTPIDTLPHGNVFDLPVSPHWTEGESSQYDQYAELAGY